MCKGAVFKSNTFQAVRLPKGMDFPDSVKQVDIIPIGNGRLIVPAGEGWDSWFDGPVVTKDCLANRGQPNTPERQDQGSHLLPDRLHF